VFVASKALIFMLPGDPIEVLMGETGVGLPVEELRVELGLDEPFHRSLVSDFRSMVTGDWGQSLFSRAPVGPQLWSAFKATLSLAGLTLFLALLMSLPLGLWGAHQSKGLGDAVVTAFGALMAALPIPWVGPILILIFCWKLQWFPLQDDIWLPALTLALSYTGSWARLVRERTLETLKEPWVLGARSRGVSTWKVLLKYGLGPGLGGLLAYWGTQVGGLMSGTVITEIIFGWQGLGSMMVDAVLSRDFPVIEATLFLSTLMILLGQTVGNLLQRVWDPRLTS